MTVLLDDHLLRDWMTAPDRALRSAVNGEALATTNLWYVRLCKSAAQASHGALLGGLDLRQRAALGAALVRLPDDITIAPMRELAWRMGALISEGSGLSTLGAEAVAAADVLGCRILASRRDDSPGIRRCCERLRIRYATIER